MLADVDDVVYPLHFVDDLALQRMLIHYLWQFDGKLDAGKLQDSLARLLHMGDWRKLGGRLRKNANRNLEIHVPSTWSEDRPPFLFFHDSLGVTKDKHQLAKYLRCGNSKQSACIQPISADLTSLTVTPKTPAKFRAWIDRDVPVLSVRVTCFTDCTLVGITWPHSLTDASGIAALMQAWSLVLAGRDKSVPPIIGSYTDVLSQAVHSQGRAREDLALWRWRLKGWARIEWLLRFVYRVIWNGRSEVRRIHLPQGSMSRLKARILGEMQRETETREKADAVDFVSDNSILTAWFTRMVARAARTAQSVLQVNFVNARYRIASVRDVGGVFMQNMILPWFDILSHDEVLGGSIGRLVLAQQRKLPVTEQQMLALFEYLETAHKTGRNPLLALVIGHKKEIPLGFNNLTRVNIIKAPDFGPAVLLQSDEGRESQIYEQGRATGFTFVVDESRVASFVVITGKDHADDYHMIARLTMKEWSVVEEELRCL